MRIGRAVPPAAAPLGLGDLWHGALGLAGKDRRPRVEAELREYLGVRHVALVSSGKAALAVILRALARLAPGRDEALLPAYTCFSVPSAVCREGLAPALCDVDPRTLDFDRRLLETALTPRTLCVVPTHLFGRPADVERALEQCRPRGVFVVEDAAQALGVRCGGRLLGTRGDVGFFSFGRGKHLSCGSGGAIVTDSADIGGAVAREMALLDEPGPLESARQLAETVFTALFIHPSLYWIPAGLPFLGLGETVFDPGFPVRRLSRVQAGLLHGWRPRLEAANDTRRKNAAALLAALGKEANGEPGIPYLRLPLLAGSAAGRDALVRTGASLGVSRMYPSPVGDIAELRSRFAGAAFPGARAVAERLLTLPTHQLLAGRDLEALGRLLQGGRVGAGGSLRRESRLGPVVQ